MWRKGHCRNYFGLGQVDTRKGAVLIDYPSDSSYSMEDRDLVIAVQLRSSQLTSDIHKSFINKQHLIAAFLNIESAYPNVHISTLGLSNILSLIGLPPHLTQYITFMFSNRRILC